MIVISLSRYYTSIEQVQTYARDYRPSIVGTIMSNRVNLPEELRYARGRELPSVFVWQTPLMLVSYIPTRGKNVLVVSSMHEEDYITHTAARKPDNILFYNETKGGDDTVDQMIDTYRAKAATRRWPMVMLYTIVDVAALNSMVILQHTNNMYFAEPPRKHRRHFLLDLGKALVKPQIEKRATNQYRLPKYVTKAMSVILGRHIGAPTPVAAPAPPGPPGKCALCIQQHVGNRYKTNKRKANNAIKTCTRCNREVCGKHFAPPCIVLCTACDGQ